MEIPPTLARYAWCTACICISGPLLHHRPQACADVCFARTSGAASIPFPDPLGFGVSVSDRLSLSLSSSAQGLDRLTDRWLSTRDKGRRGNTGGVGAGGWTSGAVSHVRPVCSAAATWGRGGKGEGLDGGEEEMTVCLRRGSATTGLLALERFHAPISNETHRARRTRAAAMQQQWLGIVLAQLTARIR